MGPGALGAQYRAPYRLELDETEMIKRYAAMVKRIASHLKGRLPQAVQLDDLIQAGLIAVLRIARQSASSCFEDALLRRSIMNAMIDEARRQAWAPVRTIRLAKAAGQAMRAVKLRNGRDGSDEEIAAELRTSLAEYQQILVEIAGLHLMDLDEFDADHEEGLRVTDDQEAALQRSRMLTALARSIASLPEREKLVVSLYYEQELNMDEVAQVLGLSKATICRIHGRALLMLRNALSDWSATADTRRQASGD
jgi:RNA polymerase sigma factor FliA